MIEFVKDKPKVEENLSSLQPYVREWFNDRFKRLTPPQEYSFKLIKEGHNVIITAPTGSGKTLSAFLSIISELFRMGENEELEDNVYCIYISPLKALNNDIEKNLVSPLEEIRRFAMLRKMWLPKITIGLRTGDTTAYERQKQIKKPPHILITTPESIAILLNSPKFVERLRHVRWVIVDEIHELASSKRGVHLSLSLERLEEIAGKRIQRIGMGATLYPLEEVAKYLVGYKDGEKRKLRSCKIIDVSWVKKYDLKVMTPVKDIVNATPEEINNGLYILLDKLISSHRTTLIFTNTRSGTERVIYNLKKLSKEKYNDNTIAAHHGSLSRKTRLDVEDRLKKGKLKAVVCSTSLELGVDIGYIDLVVQLGSPKSVTRAVQRIGRCGRDINDVAKGILIAIDIDDLVECSVMLKNAKEKKLDSIQIPKNCLDILAQHIVGMALTRKWGINEALRLIRRSYNYVDIDEKTFEQVIKYLSGNYMDLRNSKVYGKIWYDEKDKVFGRRGKHTRIIYYLNSGSIPDEVKVDVYLYSKGRYIGGIEEGFLERLKKGDIFVLGGRLYKFRFSRGMRCYVDEAPKDALPTIPAWFSEMLPLSFELALSIQEFRSKIKSLILKNKNVMKYLMENYPIDKHVAKAIYEYFKAQIRYTNGIIPDSKTIGIEITKDLNGREFVVFHALYGRRTNDALSRAIAVIASDWMGRNVGVVVNDNGFAIVVPRRLEIEEIENIINGLMKRDIEKLLKRNISRTELLKRRFRHNAARSFLVLRNYLGHKISVKKQQITSQKLYKICESIDPNFPVVKETFREILEDVFDLKNAERVIEMMKSGKVGYKIYTTPVASLFSHNLILLGQPDIVLVDDKRKRLIELHKEVMKYIKG